MSRSGKRSRNVAGPVRVPASTWTNDDRTDLDSISRRLAGLEQIMRALSEARQSERSRRAKFALVALVISILTLMAGAFSGYVAVLGFREPAVGIGAGRVVVALSSASPATVGVGTSYNRGDLTYQLQFPTGSIGQRWLLVLVGTGRMKDITASVDVNGTDDDVKVDYGRSCGDFGLCDIVTGTVKPTNTTPGTGFQFPNTGKSSNPVVTTCEDQNRLTYPTPPAVERVGGSATQVEKQFWPFFVNVSLPTVVGGFGKEPSLTDLMPSLTAGFAPAARYHIPTIGGCQVVSEPSGYKTVDATPEPQDQDAEGASWSLGANAAPSATYKADNTEAVSNFCIIFAGAAIAFSGGLFPLWLEWRLTDRRTA